MKKVMNVKEDEKIELRELNEKEKEIQIDRILKSKCQILLKYPFFGILLLKLELRETNEIETAGTDGKTLYINLSFIEQLTDKEINWVLIHEILHCVLKHMWRKGERNQQLFNIAADYAIHDMMMQYKEFINEEGYKDDNGRLIDILEKPKMALYDKKFKNMTAEEIYDIIKKNAKYIEQQTLDDHSKWDENLSEEEKQKRCQEWDGNVIGTAKNILNGKNAGTLPKFLKRLIEGLLKPQKNWRLLLSEFITPEINDYSFSPPDKRLNEISFGIDSKGNPIQVLLPDFNDTIDVVKQIYFVVDTSGSIGDEELKIVYSEIVGAINQFAGKLTGSILFFDHKAYDPIPFESVNDVLKMKPIGGGGTDFYAPFELIQEKKIEDINGIVFLTDGYADFPPENIANGIPVLWIMTTDIKPTWGIYTKLSI